MIYRHEIFKGFSVDIQQEITNHLEWIETIASLLSNEKLAEEDFEEMTQHDNCKLGQWLNSEAALAFKDLPDFQKLIESHAEFHKLAGNMILSLQQDKEAAAIGAGDEFIRMSHELINYLQVLQEITDKK